jgi:hypothetical protein
LSGEDLRNDEISAKSHAGLSRVLRAPVMGTLDKFAGRLTDAEKMKKLEYGESYLKLFSFFWLSCVIVAFALFIASITFAIFSGKSLDFVETGKSALVLSVFVLTTIGLKFTLKRVRAEKVELILKIENTPPLTAEELNFDPSKYVEPTQL